MRHVKQTASAPSRTDTITDHEKIATTKTTQGETLTDIPMRKTSNKAKGPVRRIDSDIESRTKARRIHVT
jgi:hypothetical protein